VTQKRLDEIADLLNHRPRKVLGAIQVTQSSNIFRKKKVGSTEVLVISADRFLRYLI